MENKNEQNRLAYQALLDENAHDLYENAPCGYFSSLLDGTIVKINQTLLNWLGYAREQIIHVKKFQDLLAIGGKIFYETHHDPLIQMQGFINEISYDIVCKNGSTIPVLMNSIQVKDSQNEVLLVRSTLFNITDRKKYERELLLAKKKAEQAAKVKSEFLSTVSHEIRTPMNAIIGITHLLFKTELTPKQLEFVNILSFSSQNLLHLINDILDFTKIESGKISLAEKTINLKKLVEGIIYSLRLKAEEKNVPIQVEIDQNLPEYLLGDPVKINQVLTNLLNNAIKFTQQGQIDVGIKVQSLSDTDASIEFMVKDTGIGIPKDKLGAIFEEFSQASYQINIEYGGTGLGLAISQKLLELYGSKIRVESELGRGSTFYFTLQLKLSSEHRVNKESNTDLVLDDSINGRDGLKGIKLLLAEDNRINVMVMSEFLTNWGVEFDVAKNGREVVEKVLTQEYDMILMDLQMPEMTGYEAAKQITNFSQEKYKKLPIIALSASAKIDIQERMEAAGIRDFVSKPFDPMDLFAKIATYGRYKRSHLPETNRETLGDFPQKPDSTPFPENTPVQLDQLIKLTKNRQDRLASILEMTIQDFSYYKHNFILAIEKGDLAEYDFMAHKSKMSITLLEAKKLLELINQGRKVMETEELVRRTQVKTEIEAEFEKIIITLKRHSSTLH